MAAEAGGTSGPQDGHFQAVCFMLGSEEYALDIAQVQEIIRLPEIRSVPRSPDFVEGVVNLRGKILPVIDLRKRFNLPAGDPTRKSRIVVVNLPPIYVGLQVDAVTEVLQIPVGAVEPAPDLVMTSLDASYIRGIAKLDARLLVVLDLGRILAPREVEALAGAGDALPAS
jgi:purine-binding chemotaxis protein CheW